MARIEYARRIFLYLMSLYYGSHIHKERWFWLENMCRIILLDANQSVNFGVLHFNRTAPVG